MNQQQPQPVNTGQPVDIQFPATQTVGPDAGRVAGLQQHFAQENIFSSGPAERPAQALSFVDPYANSAEGAGLNHGVYAADPQATFAPQGAPAAVNTQPQFPQDTGAQYQPVQFQAGYNQAWAGGQPPQPQPPYPQPTQQWQAPQEPAQPVQSVGMQTPAQQPYVQHQGSLPQPQYQPGQYPPGTQFPQQPAAQAPVATDPATQQVAAMNEQVTRLTNLVAANAGIQPWGRSPEQVMQEAERQALFAPKPQGGGQQQSTDSGQTAASAEAQAKTDEAFKAAMTPVFDQYDDKFTHQVTTDEGKPGRAKGMDPTLRSLYSDMSSHTAKEVLKQTPSRGDVQALTGLVEGLLVEKWHTKATNTVMQNAAAAAAQRGQPFNPATVRVPSIQETYGWLSANPQVATEAFSRWGHMDTSHSPFDGFFSYFATGSPGAGIPQMGVVPAQAQWAQVQSMQQLVPPAAPRQPAAAQTGLGRVNQLRVQLAGEPG
jgi:hypothetical protein